MNLFFAQAATPAISLSWDEAGAISAIALLLVSLGALFMGLKYVSNRTYYATREADEKSREDALQAARAELLKETESLCGRVNKLETEAQVLSAGVIRQLIDGMADVRAELHSGRVSRDQLAEVIKNLQFEVVGLRNDSGRGSR